MNTLQQDLFFNNKQRIKKAWRDCGRLLKRKYPAMKFDLIIKDKLLIVELRKVPFTPINMFWNPNNLTCPANPRWSREYEGMLDDMLGMLQEFWPGHIDIVLKWSLYLQLKERQYYYIDSGAVFV